MLPTVSSSNKFRAIPKLPEISCDQGEEEEEEDSIEEESSGDHETVKRQHRQCDGFESDEDIEILLRKTKFLRHSKSAHADLALPTSNRKKTNLLNGYGITEEKENSSSDSDEEFYVHQSLLPFRKSKSSTLGFEGIEAKTVEIKNLGTFKASKVLEVIEKQTAEMLKSQEPEVATFVSNTIDYWPPPEEEGEDSELHKAISRRISKAKKSIVSENESHGFPLIPFGRTASVDSDGIISVGAWSAPAQVASDSGENSEDEIIGGQKMRSWSATERPCTNENDEEKFCTKKGISLSCERSHHCIYDEIVDELWKGHLSCDDLTEPEIIYDETSDSPLNIDYNQNPFNCIQEMEEFSCSPGLNINLQTPSSFTPSPVMPGSKSDSALRFYATDRPKTPLCGEPNPSNSTQEIYDPWHADVDDLPAQPGPIRSRSCHDTFESTGTDEEARMLRHCQMCPSPDCKQIIEQKFSSRDNANLDSESADEETDEEEDARIKKAFEAQIEKMQQFAEGETASLLVHHEDDGSVEDEEDINVEDGDCDNRSFTVYDDEIPMADDPTIDSPLNAYLVKKFILSRSSPPMASEDDLSDVEMTEIGTDDEESSATDLPPKHDLRYNLSSMLVRKSHSDFGWKSAGMKTDESVGNLNYWLQEKQVVGTKTNVKRSSTTSAMLHHPHRSRSDIFQKAELKKGEEPIYANLPQFLFNNKNVPVKSKILQQQISLSSSSMNQRQPKLSSAASASTSSKERIFPWNSAAASSQQQHQHSGAGTRMHKSATFVGVQGHHQPQRNRNVRRLLPLRPDFPATPEEPQEYVNLPYSTSYHEQVGSHSDTAPSSLCFFPTTSYNCSKELQHENFARIQMQMSSKNEPSSSMTMMMTDGGEMRRYDALQQQQQQQQRPSKLFSQQSRGPSFTALTLADELENEKRGIPPERIDPILEKRITEGQHQIPMHPSRQQQQQRLEDPSPMSPGNFFPQSASASSSKRPQQRRTLPPLPIEAHSFAAFAAAAAMAAAQSPTIFPIPSRGSSNHPPPNQPQPKEDHQICYGIEASMLRSTSGIYGIEDSYYEDGINGNFTTTRKSTSVFNNQEDSSGVSSCCTGTDSINPTHRVQSVFIPRHDDEILLEIGDAIHVERECEDHWCYGTNLRTGQHGIFPAAHICEIDLVEEICNSALINATTRVLPSSPERDTFYLTMLASIEVAHHKGNDVLVQSINKVCSMYQDKEEIIVPQTVLMEVSFRGIHIIDKRRKDFFKCPAFDFFYSLQNISFCGAHPKQLRYFGFITKHPLLPRFACHVFLSNESTQPIVESIGRAFKRSYDEYMAFAHPTEDIYIE